MSKITGIGIALLLVICVPKILTFYDISMSTYAPYLAFLIFIIILAFILPHNFLVTVDTVANSVSSTNTIGTTGNMGIGTGTGTVTTGNMGIGTGTVTGTTGSIIPVTPTVSNASSVVYE